MSSDGNKFNINNDKNKSSSKFKKYTYLTENERINNLENTIPDNNNTLFSFKKSISKIITSEDVDKNEKEKKNLLIETIEAKNSSSNYDNKDGSYKNDDPTPELSKSILTLKNLTAKNNKIKLKNNFTLKKLDSN